MARSLRTADILRGTRSLCALASRSDRSAHAGGSVSVTPWSYIEFMTNSGTEQLEQELVATQQSIARSMAHLFDLMLQLEDADEGPRSYPDTATWFAWNLGFTRRTSRRWVRLARSLTELPSLRSAFASGIVSLEQLSMLLRVADPDNEADLLAVAREVGDTDGLRDEIKALEAELTDEHVEEPRDLEPTPELAFWWHDDAFHYTGKAPGSDGVLVERALLRLAEQAPRDEATGLYRNMELRAGEALVQMASESLGADADPDRATMVVHVNAADLIEKKGPGWDTASRIFSPAQLEELACDARIQPALDNGAGVTVGVGRTTRKIPHWLRRLVEGRDRTCRFPGCHHTRWLHIHHRIPWSQGGPTNLDNLIALCGFHHRMLHRDGWAIEGAADSDLRFYNRWGLLHTPARYRFPLGWERLRLDHIDDQADDRLTALANAPP